MRRFVLLVALFTPAAAFAVLPPLFESARDILLLARECALPPTRPGEEVVRVDQLPFTAAAMKDYAADVSLDEIRKNPEKYRLRVAVLDAFQTIRDEWATTPDLPTPKFKKMPRAKGPRPGVFLTRVPATITAAFKDSVKAYQVFPATALLKLGEAAGALEAVAPLRAKEPKRWQAHFDHALAQCRARMVFLDEYDLALGYVLREDLPELDAKKGYDGWRLAGSEKMLSKKDVRERAAAARGLFEKIAADHKGTPWSALARRELAAPPGLKWEPATK